MYLAHLSVDKQSGDMLKLNENEIYRLIIYHKLYISPSILSQLNISSIVIDQLKKHYKSRASRGFNNFKHILLINELAEKQGIDLVFIKGLAFAKFFYNDVFQRFGNDIDIYAKNNDYIQIRNLLTDNNYELINERSYRGFRNAEFKHAEGIAIDLQESLHNLSGKKYKEEIDAFPLLKVDINGCILQTLNDEAYLSYLSVHGASHMWYKLKWIKDIYLICESIGSKKVQDIISKTKNRGVKNAIMLAVNMSNYYFGSTVTVRYNLKQRFLMKCCSITLTKGDLFSFPIRVMNIIFQFVLFSSASERIELFTGVFRRKLNRLKLKFARFFF